MFGKIFESLYEGSMIGAGSAMFAVWGYVIAHMKPDKVVGAQVELNTKLVSFVLGETEEVVKGVVDKLCDPDDKSRSKEKDGRRLIRLGEFTYQVVNGAHYMSIRKADERREYFRNYRRNQRCPKNGSGSTEYLPGQSEAGISPSPETTLVISIYESYPRKVGKPAAIKAIVSALKKISAEELLKKTQAFASAKAGADPQFIPHPSTWFTQERFNDDPSTWINNGSNQAHAGTGIGGDSKVRAPDYTKPF